ncbi:MAG: rRNA maturation RNase YbeY [Kofleriaceae bacterium]
MLALTVDAEVRALAPWRAELRRQVTRMIVAAARTEGRAALEVSLRLTNDAVIRELNRDFRAKDRPTDVLAFAQREGPPTGAGQELLGDVVISLETARGQAKRKTAAGLLVEVRFLAAHGLCHLLGYDHRDDDEEQVMNARMAALLEQAQGRGVIHAA